jgi:hypothetical protein
MNTEKKKRSKVINVMSPSANIKIEVVEDESVKKKGRKPKGGKLVNKPIENVVQETALANIILHLKCTSKDLTEYNSKTNSLATISYNPVVPNIMTYENSNFCAYDDTRAITTSTSAYDSETVCKICRDKHDNTDEDVSIKDVNAKLKRLKINLYKNSLLDKKSACFWCTYEYDNPPFYIPKYESENGIFAYGSFCRPECAVAYLLKENLDDSTKFERYHLINHIYGKICDYKKNIKPAPDPYYTLDKFYGNLSIQEYRKLLKTEHMLLTIEKPLTRTLPELHEETDDMLLNIGANKNNIRSYKVKRQSEKTTGPSKSNIMLSTFGINT